LYKLLGGGVKNRNRSTMKSKEHREESKPSKSISYANRSVEKKERLVAHAGADKGEFYVAAKKDDNESAPTVKKRTSDLLEAKKREKDSKEVTLRGNKPTPVVKSRPTGLRARQKEMRGGFSQTKKNGWGKEKTNCPVRADERGGKGNCLTGSWGKVLKDGPGRGRGGLRTGERWTRGVLGA